MVVTYTTAANVAALLTFNQSDGFTTSTVPTTAQVETMINQAEDTIDAITNHAWRTVTIGAAASPDEIFEFPAVPRYGYSGGYYHYHSTGIPLFLRHRHIKSLSAGSGDVFEVWNGSIYEDWLTIRTEGREADWWLDNQQGILYIRTSLSLTAYDRAVRLVYRFGEATVPKDIEDMATKMVALKILTAARFVPDGLNIAQIGEQVRTWREDIDRITHTRIELKVVAP